MRVGFIGFGLIAASIYQALAKAQAAEEFLIFDPDPAALAGVSLKSDATHAVVRVADLHPCQVIFVCAPVRAIAARVSEALHSCTAATVTDVGSTKQAIQRAVAATSGAAAVRFVPGHPMAGDHRAGARYGCACLLDAKTYFLTPDATTDRARLATIAQLVRRIGANPVECDAQAHDRLVAYLSHLPHLMAFALVRQAAKVGAALGFDPLDYAGASFHDLTRVAASDTAVWTDIFLENSHEVAAQVLAFQAELQDILALAEGGDATALAAALDNIRACRTRLEGEV